jgi:hypothetical protein
LPAAGFQPALRRAVQSRENRGNSCSEQTDFPPKSDPMQAEKSSFRKRVVLRQFSAPPGGLSTTPRSVTRGDKTACIVSLQAEIDRLGGVPYGWIKIYEVLLFAFYNPRTAIEARCGVRTVQRALKWHGRTTSFNGHMGWYVTAGACCKGP